MPAAHRCGARRGPSRNPAPGQEAHKTGCENIPGTVHGGAATPRPQQHASNCNDPQQEMHFLC